MLQKRWQGCVFLFAFLLCSASGIMIPSENSPSEFVKIVQSKQTKQGRVCRPDPELLRSLAGSDAEVMLTIPNDQLEHIAEFQEEADLWVITYVARFLPATRITHVLAGDDVPTSSPGSAYFLVPAMLNLRSALAAAGLDGRVKVSTAVSAEALASPAWSGAVGRHALRFLRAAGSPLLLKSRPSEASDAQADAAYGRLQLEHAGGREPADEPVPSDGLDTSAGLQPAVIRPQPPGGRHDPSVRLRPAGRRRLRAPGRRFRQPAVRVRAAVGVRPAGLLQRQRVVRAQRHAQPLRGVAWRHVGRRLGCSVRRCGRRPSRVHGWVM